MSTRPRLSTDEPRLDRGQPDVGELLRVETDDGREVSVEISNAREYASRVDVTYRGRWVFGVDSDGDAHLLFTFDGDGDYGENHVPEWVKGLLQRVGVNGVVR